jgi:serine/threonine protein kinase
VPENEPASTPVGTTLGAYEITALIATGGMGAVYLATHRITGERRALKIMRPELAASGDFVARFMREVKIAATVEHPNLVRVFEPGMEGETVFLPMELLEGATLADRIRRGGALGEDDAIAIVRAVGQAVLAVHRAGIIHRDLKPSNIFLARTAEGDVIPKVLDLGAAKIVKSSEEETAAGLTIGSPHYMSFEQASGARDIDARTDQYSLGVVLYHALTGGRPYENDDSGNALAKVLAGAPFKRPRQLVPSLSPATEKAVLRAISRDRAERFPTLEAFLEALPEGEPDLTRVAELTAPKPTAAQASKGRSGPTVVAPRPASWSNAEGAMAGIGAALVVGLLAFLLMRHSFTRPDVRTDLPAASVAAAPSASPVAVAPPPPVAPLPAMAPSVAPEAPPPPPPAPPPPSATAAPPKLPTSKPAAPATRRAGPNRANTRCVPAPGLPCF